MKHYVMTGIALLLLAAPTMGQSLERMFYSPFYKSVEDGMRIGVQKHAIYSYIVANISTPGLDLVALLPPEDQQKLEYLVPLDEEKKRAVVLEYVLSLQAMNNRRTQALTTIWGGKAKSLKNVVTLGK